MKHSTFSQIGAVHYNFPGFTLEQFIQFVRNHGGNCVELQIVDIWGEKINGVLDESTFAAACANARQVRETLDRYGVRASSLAACNDFVQIDPIKIAAQVARMELIGKLANIVGSDTLLRSEGGQPNNIAPEHWLNSMYECFARCAQFAERLDIRLAIDNHGEITNDAGLLLKLLEKVNHPRIGANLDTMNYRWFGYSVEECRSIYKTMSPYTFQAHFKDGHGSRQEYRGAALGEGELDLQCALDCLNEANYQGAYLAEYEGKELEEGIGYAKCLHWLQ